MLNKELFPTITQPTRITKQSATLIDNVFVSLNLHKKFDSAILINDMSDHLPMLTLLRQTNKNTNLLVFESRNLNDKKKIIKQSLYKIDWIRKLTGANCNENYNIFTKILKQTMDEISPIERVWISGKRRYIEPWMSRGLEISSRKKESLYKKHS